MSGLDEIEALGEIYDAVGDADRWLRLQQRLATAHQISPQIERHLEIARLAHEHHLGVSRQIELLSNVHNQINLGGIVVDGDGLVVRVNNAAGEILTERDGLEVVTGRLRAVNQSDDTTLQRAIARAASGDSANGHMESPFILVTRAGRLPLVLLVVRRSPALQSFLEHPSLVTLLVVDPDRAASPAIDVLRGIYGFTEREAEFAALLMRGLGVNAAALALGVAVTTARTFLAHIREKTDTHNQAEVMQRLLAIPWVIGSDRDTDDAGSKAR